MNESSNAGSANVPDTAKAPAPEDDFTTRPGALAFWIAAPVVLLLLFALFSELTGAK